MDTPGITGPTPAPPPPASYGVGRLKHDRDRRNRQSFEDAFAKEEKKRPEPEEEDTSVAEDDTPENHAKIPLPGGLQDRRGIIRKDEEDGQLHVDIVV